MVIVMSYSRNQSTTTTLALFACQRYCDLYLHSMRKVFHQKKAGDIISSVAVVLRSATNAQLDDIVVSCRIFYS